MNAASEADYNDIFAKIYAAPSKPWKQPVKIEKFEDGHYEITDGDGVPKLICGEGFFQAVKQMKFK